MNKDFNLTLTGLVDPRKPNLWEMHYLLKELRTAYLTQPGFTPAYPLSASQKYYNLCGMISMYIEPTLVRYVLRYIRANCPKAFRTKVTYWWDPEQKDPRVLWLEKQIAATDPRKNCLQRALVSWQCYYGTVSND